MLLTLLVTLLFVSSSNASIGSCPASGTNTKTWNSCAAHRNWDSSCSRYNYWYQSGCASCISHVNLRCSRCTRLSCWSSRTTRCYGSCSTSVDRTRTIRSMNIYQGHSLYLRGRTLTVRNRVNVYSSGASPSIYGPGTIRCNEFYFQGGHLRVYGTDNGVLTIEVHSRLYIYNSNFKYADNVVFKLVGNARIDIESNTRVSSTFHTGYGTKVILAGGNLNLPSVDFLWNHRGGELTEIIFEDEGSINKPNSDVTHRLEARVTTTGDVFIPRGTLDLPYGVYSTAGDSMYSEWVFGSGTQAKLLLNGVDSYFGANVSWVHFDTNTLSSMSRVEFYGGSHYFEHGFIWDESRFNIDWGGNSWIEFGELGKTYIFHQNMNFTATVRLAPQAASIGNATNAILRGTTTVYAGGLQVGGHGIDVEKLVLKGGRTSFELDTNLGNDVEIDGGLLGGCANYAVSDHPIVVYSGGFFGCNQSIISNSSTNPTLTATNPLGLEFQYPGPHFVYGRNILIQGRPFAWNSSDIYCGGASHFILDSSSRFDIYSDFDINMFRDGDHRGDDLCEITIPSAQFNEASIEKTGSGMVTIAATLFLDGYFLAPEASIGLHGGGFLNGKIEVCDLCGIEYGGREDAVMVVSSTCDYLPKSFTRTVGGVTFVPITGTAPLIGHILDIQAGNLTFEPFLRSNYVHVGGNLTTLSNIETDFLNLTGGHFRATDDVILLGDTISSGGSHLFDTNFFTNDIIQMEGGTITFTLHQTLPNVDLHGSGSLVFNADSTITLFSMSESSHLSGSGNITISDPATWNGGTISGPISVDSKVKFTSFVNIDSSFAKFIISKDVVFEDSATWTQGRFRCWNHGSLTIPETSVFTDDNSIVAKHFTYGPDFILPSCATCDQRNGTSYEGQCAINVLGKFVQTGGRGSRYNVPFFISSSGTFSATNKVQTQLSGGLFVNGTFLMEDGCQLDLEETFITFYEGASYNNSGTLRAINGLSYFSENTFTSWLEDEFEYTIRNVSVPVGSELVHVCRNVTLENEFATCTIENTCFGCFVDDDKVSCNDFTMFGDCLPSFIHSNFTFSSNYSDFQLAANYTCSFTNGHYLIHSFHDDIISIDCWEEDSLLCLFSFSSSPAITADKVRLLECSDGLRTSNPVQIDYVGSTVSCDLFIEDLAFSEIGGTTSPSPSSFSCNPINDEFNFCLLDNSYHLVFEDGECNIDVYVDGSIPQEVDLSLYDIEVTEADLSQTYFLGDNYTCAFNYGFDLNLTYHVDVAAIDCDQAGSLSCQLSFSTEPELIVDDVVLITCTDGLEVGSPFKLDLVVVNETVECEVYVLQDPFEEMTHNSSVSPPEVHCRPIHSGLTLCLADDYNPFIFEEGECYAELTSGSNDYDFVNLTHYDYQVPHAEIFKHFTLDHNYTCAFNQSSYLIRDVYYDVTAVECWDDGSLLCKLTKDTGNELTVSNVIYLNCSDFFETSNPVQIDYVGSTVSCELFIEDLAFSEIGGTTSPSPSSFSCHPINDEFTYCLLDNSYHLVFADGVCYLDDLPPVPLPTDFEFVLPNFELSTSMVYSFRLDSDPFEVSCTAIPSITEQCGTEAVTIFEEMPRRVPVTGAREDWIVTNGNVTSVSNVGLNTFIQSGGDVHFTPSATVYLFEDFFISDGIFKAESDVFTFASGYISGETGDILFTQPVDIFSTIEFTGSYSHFNNSLTASECRFFSGEVVVYGELHCGFFQFQETNLRLYGDFFTPQAEINGGSLTLEGADFFSSETIINGGEVVLNALISNNVIVNGGYVVILEGFTCNLISVNGGVLETRGSINAINISINGGLWNSSSTVETQYLFLNGGEIDGDSDIVVLNKGHWISGLFNGTGTTNFRGGLEIRGEETKFISEREIIMDSDINWTNGNVSAGDGAIIAINDPYCLKINTLNNFIVQENVTVTPKLLVFGCIQKLVVGYVELQFWTLNNGTITLNPDTQTLAFWGGECNSRFTPSIGSTLQFQRFYQTMEEECLIRGDGKVVFGGDDSAFIEMKAFSMLDVQTGIDIEFGQTDFLPEAEVRSVGEVMTIYNGVANFAPGSSFVLRAVVSKGGFVYGRGDLFLSSHFSLEGGESLWLSVLANRGNITGGTHTFNGAASIQEYMNVIGGTVLVGGDLLVPEMNTIGGTVNVSGDVSATKLVQVGGLLEGTGIIRALDSLIWEGGVVAGSGVLRSDNQMFVQGDTHTLIQRTIDNRNDLYWLSGDIIGHDGADFRNSPSGKFYIMTGNSSCKMIHASGALPQFMSLGETTKYNSSDVEIQFEITHSGFMYVLDGTLSLSSGGNYSSLVHVEGDGTFELAGGDATFSFGAFLRVEHGLFEVSGGRVAIDQSWYNITDRMEVSGGRIDFYPQCIMVNNGRHVHISGGIMHLHRTDTIFGYVLVTDGELHLDAIVNIIALSMDVPGGSLVAYRELVVSGTADLYAGDLEVDDLTRISGLLSWYGGAISGDGRISTTGSFDIYQGPTPKELRIADFFNDDEGRWHGGSIYAYDGSVFRNRMDSSFKMIPGGDLLYGNGTMSVFENLGLIYKAGSGIAQINIFIDQRSLVNITQGHLNVSGGQESSGTYQVHEGTTLEFGGGKTELFPGSTVQGLGDVIFSGGISYVTCTYNIDSVTYHTGGESNWDPGLDLINLGLWLNISGGVMAFHGYPLFVENVDSSGGSLTSDSQVEVRDLWIQSGGVHRLDGTFTINGEVHLSGGDLGGAGRTLTKSSIFWSGGEISGTNILDVPEPFYIIGPNNKTLTNRRVETFNHTYYIDGDVYGRNGGALIISTVATLHFVPGGNMYYMDEGRVPLIGNAGHILKYREVYNQVEWYVENIASINITRGHVNFAGGGWYDGQIFTDSDTIIEFGDRVATFAPDNILYGTGNLLFSGGLSNVLSRSEFILAPVGSMTVDGGEVNVEDHAWLNVRSLIVQGPPESSLNFLGTSRMRLPELFVHGGQVRSRAHIEIPHSFNFTGGLTTWMGKFQADGDGIISSGIHTFTYDSVFHGVFTLTGDGVIGGEGWLDTREAFLWEGGSLTGASPITSRGGVKIYTDLPKYMDERLLQNENLVEWLAGDIFLSNLAVVNNSKSAHFLINFDNSTFKMEHVDGVVSYIDNEGLVTMNSSVDSTVEMSLLVNNFNTLNIVSGEYQSSTGGLESTGSITTFDDGVFHVIDGQVNLLKGVVFSNGSFLQSGGTSYVRQVVWTLNSVFNITGGDLIFFSSIDIIKLADPFLVTGGTVDFRLAPPTTDHWIIQGGLLMYHCNSINITHLDVSSGTLTGKGPVYAQNYFAFSGGKLDDTGFVYSPVERIEGPETKYIEKFRIWNFEDLIWTEGDIVINDGGSIEVNQTGTFAINLISPASMSNDYFKRDGILLNHGYLAVDSGANLFHADLLWNTTATGKTAILSGDVNPNYKFFMDGGSLFTVETNGLLYFTNGRFEFLSDSILNIIGSVEVSTDSVVYFGGIVTGSEVIINQNGRLRMMVYNDVTALSLIRVNDGFFDLGDIESNLPKLVVDDSDARVVDGYLNVDVLELLSGLMKFTSVRANISEFLTADPFYFEQSNLIVLNQMTISEGDVIGSLESAITVLDQSELEINYSDAQFKLESPDSSSRIINYGLVKDSIIHNANTEISWKFDDSGHMVFENGGYLITGGGGILRNQLTINSPCTVVLSSCSINSTDTFTLNGDGKLEFTTNSDSTFNGHLEFAGNFVLSDNAYIHLSNNVSIAGMTSLVELTEYSEIFVYSIDSKQFFPEIHLKDNSVLHFDIQDLVIDALQMSDSSTITSTVDSSLILSNVFTILSGDFNFKGKIYNQPLSRLIFNGNSASNYYSLLNHGEVEWLSGNVVFNSEIFSELTGQFTTKLSSIGSFTTSENGKCEFNSLFTVDNSAGVRSTFRIPSVFDNSQLILNSGEILLGRSDSDFDFNNSNISVSAASVLLFGLGNFNFSESVYLEAQGKTEFTESGTTTWNAKCLFIGSDFILSASHKLYYDSFFDFDLNSLYLEDTSQFHLINSVFNYTFPISMSDSSLFNLYNNSLTIPKLSQSDSSHFTGSFILYIRDLFEFNGGIQSGEGATIIESNMEIRTSTGKFLNKRNIHVLNQATHYLGNMDGSSSARIIVYPDASFTLNPTSTVNYNAHSPWFFINYGELIKQAARINFRMDFYSINSSIIHNSGDFYLYGTTDVSDSYYLGAGGNLYLESSGSLYNNLITFSNSVLEISNSLYSHSSGHFIFRDLNITVDPAGLFRIEAGNSYFRGEIFFIGNLDVTDGDVYFDEDVMIHWPEVHSFSANDGNVYFRNCSRTIFPSCLFTHNVDIYVENPTYFYDLTMHNGGTRRSNGDLFILNHFHCQNSHFRNNGRTVIEGTSLWNGGTKNFYNSAIMEVRGTLIWLSGRIDMLSTSQVIIADSGTFRYEATQNLDVFQSSTNNDPRFIVYGVLVVSSASSDRREMEVQVHFDVFGQVFVESNSLLKVARRSSSTSYTFDVFVAGNITIESGSELDFERPPTVTFTESSILFNRGLLRLSSSFTLNFNGTLDSVATTIGSSSTLNFVDPQRIKVDDQWLEVPGANIIDLGTTTVSGTLNLNSHRYVFYDQLVHSGTIRANNYVEIDSGANFVWGGATIRGSGIFNVSSPASLQSNTHTIRDGIQIYFNSDQVVWSVGHLSCGTSGSSITLTEGAKMVHSGSNNIFQANSHCMFTISRGAEFVRSQSSGTLSVYGTFYNFGLLSGNGVIDIHSTLESIEAYWDVSSTVRLYGTSTIRNCSLQISHLEVRSTTTFGRQCHMPSRCRNIGGGTSIFTDGFQGVWNDVTDLVENSNNNSNEIFVEENDIDFIWPHIDLNNGVLKLKAKVKAHQFTHDNSAHIEYV
ncbi:hypothetical protein P9112_002989 [Eukaryota sp. TZLM1-RC]